MISNGYILILGAGVASDWIDSFLDYTDGITSPDIFRLWSAITAVSGALERRVWVETARSVLYPNLFTVLVAPPGVGKTQAITPVEELWYACKSLHVSPNNVTKAALVDALAAADRKIITSSGTLVEYHTLLVPASELGVLVPAHDLEFLSVLNYIFDSPKNYRENRRTLQNNIDIIHPQVTILAGTQPGFLASLLPEEAWSMGFTSRIIMVYSAMAPTAPLFGDMDPRSELFKRLRDGLDEMGKLMGKCLWEEDAKVELERWAAERCPPVPQHPKLTHYVSRRALHTIKLSVISAISRSQELVIKLEDVTRARDWLLAAENVMPDIFRDMANRSDSQVIQELHFFMWKLYTKDKKPIHESRLFHFLQTRVPSEKVPRVLDAAVRSSIIADIGMKYYQPRPKHEHGEE